MKERQRVSLGAALSGIQEEWGFERRTLLPLEVEEHLRGQESRSTMRASFG